MKIFCAIRRFLLMFVSETDELLKVGLLLVNLNCTFAHLCMGGAMENIEGQIVVWGPMGVWGLYWGLWSPCLPYCAPCICVSD